MLFISWGCYACLYFIWFSGQIEQEAEKEAHLAEQKKKAKNEKKPGKKPAGPIRSMAMQSTPVVKQETLRPYHKKGEKTSKDCPVVTTRSTASNNPVVYVRGTQQKRKVQDLFNVSCLFSICSTMLHLKIIIPKRIYLYLSSIGEKVAIRYNFSNVDFDSWRMMLNLKWVQSLATLVNGGLRCPLHQVTNPRLPLLNRLTHNCQRKNWKAIDRNNL